jgi:hypothetical protein
VGLNLLNFSGPLSLKAFFEHAQIRNPAPLAEMPTKSDWMLGSSYVVGIRHRF